MLTLSASRWAKKCCAGTLPLEMRQTMDNIAADPDVRPVAANSNFDQAWWEKYSPPFKKDWHCVLDQGAFQPVPSQSGDAGRHYVLGVKVDKKLR